MFKSAAQREAVVLAEQERKGIRKPRMGGMASMLGQHFGKSSRMRTSFGRSTTTSSSGSSAMYPKPWAGGTQQIYKPPTFQETSTKPLGAHGGNASRTGDVFGSAQDTMNQGLKGTTFKGY